MGVVTRNFEIFGNGHDVCPVYLHAAVSCVALVIMCKKADNVNKLALINTGTVKNVQSSDLERPCHLIFLTWPVPDLLAVQHVHMNVTARRKAWNGRDAVREAELHAVTKGIVLELGQKACVSVCGSPVTKPSSPAQRTWGRPGLSGTQAG